MDTNSIILMVALLGAAAEFFEILVQRAIINRLNRATDSQYQLNSKLSEDRTRLAISDSAKQSRIDDLLSQIVVVVGQRDSNLAALTIANDYRHIAEKRVKEIEEFLKQVVERPAHASFTPEQIAALIDHLSDNINARIKVLMPASAPRGSSGLN